MARVLLIDDDQPLRRAWRIALECAGHSVAEAGDGREGIEAFGKEPFDLVITDIIMVGMEGMETISALRKLNAEVPIVAASGGGRVAAASYLRIAHQFGAIETLEKPLELSTLCDAVQRLALRRPVPAGG